MSERNGKDLTKSAADMESMLDAMSEPELRAALAKGLQMTSEGIMYTACVVRAFDKRGIELTSDDVPGLHHFRRIASGQLLPEVFMRFFRRMSLVTKIGSLPKIDQEKIARGEPVPLAVPAPDGKGYTQRMADPLTMQPDQIKQVFAADHIRTVQEQNLILDQRRAEATKPPPMVKIRAQHRPKGLVINGLFVPYDELMAAMRRLMPENELAMA